ncbi:MAG: DNA cytosine methyltransferase [Patescibacteria group bacterium]
MKKTFKTIDLFAGVGGIRLGFEKAGFKTIYSNDFDKKCKITYDLNSSDIKLDCKDIWKITETKFPKFDVLLAGFPCQAFSIAGYKKGFEDAKGRGNLFFALEKILKKNNPRAILLENVKNLTSHDNGNTFRVILNSLESLGYNIKFKVLNSMDYGNVPQNRERVYIVGFKQIEDYNNFSFPQPKKLSIRFTDLLEENVDNKYYYEDKPLFEKLKQYEMTTGTVYQWRRKYVRENKKGVCPTLTANMGQGGHNVPIIRDRKGIRKLTPKECFSIQGFPNKFKLPNLSDSALYMQAGNSVTVPVIESIAINIKKALEGITSYDVQMRLDVNAKPQVNQAYL